MLDRETMTKLAQMAVVDRFIHVRVLGLTKWFEPARKKEIYDWPSLKEFSHELIDNRIEVLEMHGLIKTTPSYCLPKNDAICHSAAVIMMPEVLFKLES